MDNTSYTAKLIISSTGNASSPMTLEYEWDPPLRQVVDEFGHDKLPPAYQFMGLILDTAVFPTIAYNERYEAQMLEDIESENPTS